MQYALVSSTCKTTRRNITLAVEPDIKQQINLNVLNVLKYLSGPKMDLYTVVLKMEFRNSQWKSTVAAVGGAMTAVV